jgi:tellurite methyltransferase
MEFDEKALWNEKYRQGSHTEVDSEPLLVKAYADHLAGRAPGTALDIAGGAGRHALWLVQHGWRVKLVDISEAGIALARENFRKAGLSLPHALFETELADLNTVHGLGQEKYDLVIVFSYLRRELFPALAAALNPGGILVYQTYTTEQLRFPKGPHDPRFLLKPGELQSAFPSLRVLHYRENATNKATAELVARKP